MIISEHALRLCELRELCEKFLSHFLLCSTYFQKAHPSLGCDTPSIRIQITMIPENVLSVLDRHGLTPVEFEEGSTPTAKMAAEKLGVPVGNIAKSLLFVSKDQRFFLVVCPGNRRISNAKLRGVTGVKTRMATEEETLSTTGFKPGGVCPFGINGVAIVLDMHLEELGTIYPAAGTDSSGVPMSFSQLVEVTGGKIADCTNAVE